MTKLTPPQQLKIYYHYLPNGFEVGSPLLSPIRLEDTPSFVIYETKYGNFKWSDFGFSDDELFDAYDLVMEIESCNFYQATIIVNEILSCSNEIVTKSLPITKNKNSGNFNVKINNYFKDFELAYFAHRGITEQQLLKDYTFPLNELTLFNKFLAKSTSVNPKYVYLYRNYDGSVIKNTFKIYSPLDKENKWLTQNTYLANFESLPQKKHKDLMILSSRKDKQVFDNLNLKFDTTNPISEGNIKGIIRALETDFKQYGNIYALLDFDSSTTSKKGVERTKDLEERSDGRIKGLYLKEEDRLLLIRNGDKDLDEIRINIGQEYLLKLVLGLLN